MTTSDLIDKHAVRRGSVNKEPGLIAFASYLWDDVPVREHNHFARIPEGYRLVETPMEYVGLVDT